MFQVPPPCNKFHGHYHNFGHPFNHSNISQISASKDNDHIDHHPGFLSNRSTHKINEYSLPHAIADRGMADHDFFVPVAENSIWKMK